MILYRKIVLKVVLNRIVNLPETGYLLDTRYPAGYPVDPDFRYSPNVHDNRREQINPREHQDSNSILT